MSRRENRDSDSNRHSSRFERQSSPKRSRRDAKPEAERTVRKNDLDVRNRDQKESERHRDRRDAAPVESSAAVEYKSETLASSKVSEKKHDADHEILKSSSDHAQLPRSRSYDKHEERGGGRKADHRAARDDRGWWRDARDERNGRKAESERQPKGDDRSVWQHDKFQENKRDSSPPTRKRPAFRETKDLKDTETAKKTDPEVVRPFEHRDMGMGRREQNYRYLDKQERQYRGERNPHGYTPRERFNGGGQSQGPNRDRFNFGRQGYGASGKREEKWKHDLFNDANKSPVSKNEEEQIAEVEALLAS